MHVYILKCSDNSYYTGVTKNINRRLEEHKRGVIKSCYTFSRRPLEMVFVHYFKSPDQAIAFEKRIKKWRRDKKEALIEDRWEDLPELSESYTRKEKE